MRRIREIGSVAAVLTVLCLTATGAEIAFETRHLRLAVGDDGTVESLRAKRSGAEYLAQPGPLAVAYRGGRSEPSSREAYVVTEAPVYVGGESFPATAASRRGDRLVVRFDGANLTATYRVTTRPDYLAFELVGLEGGPVDRIDLVHISVQRLPHLGPWINVASDDAFGVCLCAGNVETNAGMNPGDEHVRMRAIAEREVALEGAVAVLFGYDRRPGEDFLDPKSQFLDVMEIVERDFGLPAGAKHRRLPIQRCSYFWGSPTPDDVDQYVDHAKRSGLRVVVLSYTTFSTGAGHFAWNAAYPSGMADLKAVADTIRAAGLKAGLHLHYCKAHKRDAYVTPVPDRRFHKVRAFTLASPLAEGAATIAVEENPEGCTLDDGRRILQIGNELIAYANYTTEPPFRFTGCERGHLNTTPAAYPSGHAIDLLDVDTWDVFIRFDQDTDIQDEVAERIADLCRRTGPYEFIYFDGAEDVHAPYWYHVPRAQYRVYRRIEPAPTACEAAVNMHFSWHMNTRSNAYDSFRDAKVFCRRVPFRSAPMRRPDFTRINFGWLGGFSLEPDVLEYVFSRGAAWDCPASIHVRLRDFAASPRADDCCRVMKVWEDARIEGKLTDAQRAMLRTLDPAHYKYLPCVVQRAHLSDVSVAGEGLTPAQLEKLLAPDQEHHLFVNEQGEYELVAIDEVAGLADGRLKAYTFERASRPGVAYVLLWSTGDDVTLRLPVAGDRLTAARPFGSPWPVRAEAGHATVRIGARTYLAIEAANPEQTRGLLREARAGA